MLNDSQKAALSEEMKAHMCSGDEGLIKTAGLAASEYFRTEIRENSVYRQIIPPKAVTADNFDVLEDSDFPAMLVEIQPESMGAYKVSFETNPQNASLYGKKARAEFNRIMTYKYEIDKIRLHTWKLDVLDMLYDLMLKDIMDVEDISWTEVNKNIVGWAEVTSDMDALQTARLQEYGVRRAINIPSDVPTRDGLREVKKGILRAPGNIKPAKQLMSELFYADFYGMERDEIGGDMAQDIFINGFTQTKVNGIDTLVTSKEEVCDERDVWCFADPKYYAGFYTFEDVSMVMDEKDNIWLTFFAHETVGGVVVNKAGVSVTRFDAAGDPTTWKK